MVILMILASILALGGTIWYNSLRRKMYGIIGVGGSYFATIGIMIVFMLIGSLVQGEAGAGVGEIVVYILFMLAGLGYLVFVMLTRCTTVAQRILLPFEAMMIAFGFCGRLLLAIFLRLPMETNSSLAATKFAEMIRDDQGETWYRQGDGTNDTESYRCPKTGQVITLRHTGGYYLPTGWDEC